MSCLTNTVPTSNMFFNSYLHKFFIFLGKKKSRINLFISQYRVRLSLWVTLGLSGKEENLSWEADTFCTRTGQAVREGGGSRALSLSLLLTFLYLHCEKILGPPLTGRMRGQRFEESWLLVLPWASSFLAPTAQCPHLWSLTEMQSGASDSRIGGLGCPLGGHRAWRSCRNE